MGRKWGGAAVGAGSPAWAEAYFRTKWYLDASSPLATIDIGRKSGAVPPFWGAGSPSNTMWLGPRPTCVPCFIWMHLTFWSHYTNVTEGTDRTDGTVTQTVAQQTGAAENIHFALLCYAANAGG